MMYAGLTVPFLVSLSQTIDNVSEVCAPSVTQKAIVAREVLAVDSMVGTSCSEGATVMWTAIIIAQNG